LRFRSRHKINDALDFNHEPKICAIAKRLIMNKALFTTCMLGAYCLVTTPLVSADTILGVYAGGGNWNTAYSGDIGTDGIDVENDLSLDEAGHNFFYVALEHPLPLIPNVKLQRTDIQSSGSGTLNSSALFDAINFGAGDVITDIDLSHTDLTLYYEILDNWVTVDLGVTARLFDGEAKISGSASGTLTAVTENIDINEGTPMLYAKAQFDLPFSGFAVGADLNYAGFGDSTLTDYSIRASYMANLPIIELGVELGYRSLQLKLDGLGDLEADFTVDGPYLSVLFHF
jgi:outer membrane protein